MLSAKEILTINKVGDLFTNNIAEIRKEYIELCKLWHPDNNGNSVESNEVMSKINRLYEKALSSIEKNEWETSNLIRFSCKNNKNFEFKFLSAQTFELGLTYIGNSIIIYLIENGYEDFYNNYISSISRLKYASKEMREEFEKYIPSIAERFETNDGKYGVVIKKRNDLLLLKDVFNYYGISMPDRHMAWILSSLYNLACFINYNKISHNGITLNNYYISPKYHNGSLLGGWWYATKIDSKMKGISKDLYDIMPPKARNEKIGTIMTDLESIRFIGKQLLGEKNGCKIKYNTILPKALIDWFLAGSSETAFEEYAKWNIVLTESYGKRKFIDMNVTSNNLYNK